MPKIKVKNIPEATRKRICNSVTCSKCPLCAKYYRCLRLDSSETESVVELTEQDFPTNREWLASLSNEDLALVMRTYGFGDQPSKTIEEWLYKPCEYLMEE